MAGTQGTFDRVVDAFGHTYRRRLLVSLLSHNPQDDEDAQDAEEALRALGDGAVETDTLEASLIHSHLPRLEEYGYITWDRETGDIGRGPAWAEIEPFIRLLADHQDELPDDWL